MSEQPEQPGKRPAENLVEPEGVNAGSAEATGESPDESPEAGSAPSRGDVLRGDGPATDDRAPVDPAEGDPAGGELAGAPGTDALSPGQYAAPSGQDGGSMD